MLNVQRLRVLREVVQRGSFSAAADALDYTQPAISQAVATLEAETGTTLIERDRKGLRPTAAGAALVEHTEGILARLQAAEDELNAILGVRGGHLRMATFPSAGATLMPLAIATFRAAFPDVEMTLAEAEPEDIAPRLRAGEFDIALLFEFRDSGISVLGDLRTTDLLEDPMRVALPSGHRLVSRRSLRLEHLRDEAWVQTSQDSSCARHVVHLCRAAGFDPTVSFESDDYATVQGLVAAGVGVALIPELALSSVRDDIVIRTLSPISPARRVVAATAKSPGVAPAAKPMLDVLVEVASRYALGDARVAS
jgi:DNA-binding transcriptional LysR family regulator